MKKYVKASIDSSVVEDHLDELISEANKCGYDMNVDVSEDSISVVLSNNGKLELLPVISVAVEKSTTEDGNACYYFNPSASFPDLNFSDMDYDDSFEYWVSKWADVSKFLTYMMKYKYCPDNYED